MRPGRRRAGVAARGGETPAHRRYALAQCHRADGGHQPQADREHVGHTEPGHPGRHQDDQGPFRAFADAHVAADAQSLGPRLGVRHQGPGDEAEQRDTGEQPVVAAGRQPRGEPREDPRVRHPVQGGVEEGAPRPAGPLDPGQHTVEQVQQHEDGAHAGADQQVAGGEEPEGAGEHAHRAGHRHRVGRERRSCQRLADRGEHPGDGGAQRGQHGRSILCPPRPPVGGDPGRAIRAGYL